VLDEEAEVVEGEEPKIKTIRWRCPAWRGDDGLGGHLFFGAAQPCTRGSGRCSRPRSHDRMCAVSMLLDMAIYLHAPPSTDTAGPMKHRG